MRKKRKASEVNAGSMADIAFLLLIFFLTTTSIYNDKGLDVVLPPYYEGPVGQIAEQNVAVIRINQAEKILFEGKEIEINQLGERLTYFIMNPAKRKKLPSSPNKAVVSIQNDPQISYAFYMLVYSEIKAAYRNLREDMSMDLFGKSLSELSTNEKNQIKQLLPNKISEAEYVSL